MKPIPGVKHTMFRMTDVPNPPLDAWVARNVELTAAFAADTFGDDEGGHRLASFCVHSAADLVWDAKGAGEPSWGQLDSARWMKHVDRGMSQQTAALASAILLSFLCWLVRKGHVLLATMLPPIRRLETRAAKRMRRYGMFQPCPPSVELQQQARAQPTSPLH